MASAHKGMHGAMSQELDLLLQLFRRHPEDFWRQNKECPENFWDQAKLVQAIDNCHLVPVSDPNVPSHLHRVAKALGLVQLSAMPQFASRLDPDEVLRRILAAIRVDPTGLVVQAPPVQMSPEDQAKMVTAQAKIMDANAKVGKLQTDAKDIASGHSLKQQELAAQKEIKTADITKELIIHAADQDKIASAERREAMAMNVRLKLEADEAALKRQKQGLDMVRHGVGAQTADLEREHERQRSEREQNLKEISADRDHGMRMKEFALDAQKAAHEAAVNVHETLNPKPPAKKK